MNTPQCECLTHGFCPRRNCQIASNHWARCQAGHVETLDRLYANAAKAKAAQVPLIYNPVPPAVSSQIRSGIGTRLHEIIKDRTEHFVPCSACKAEIDRLNTMTAEQVLKEIIPLSERITERASISAHKWYQRAAAKYLPGMVSAEVRNWIIAACGITHPPIIRATAAVVPKQIVCGCIHDGEIADFKLYIDKIIPGVKYGNRPAQSSHRRIIGTPETADQLLEEVKRWNGGSERPEYDTPYLANQWEYAVTSVPSRLDNLLPRTLKSLRDGGFPLPDLYVDGYISNPITSTEYQTHTRYIHQRRNVRTFAHWHMTLLDMYSRNPWAQYYAIFQDDFVCVRNLRYYIEQQTWPEKGYLNLMTFMENEKVIVDKPTGWIEAHRTAAGYQMGRGAVALVFTHAGVETLLSQPHLITRRRDSQRGHISVDGAIVEAMGQAGWIEYIHNPSLVQHTGEQSTMGNNKHPLAQSFPGEDFDVLTLLEHPHAATIANTNDQRHFADAAQT